MGPWIMYLIFLLFLLALVAFRWVLSTVRPRGGFQEINTSERVDLYFSGTSSEDIFKFISDIEDVTGWFSERARVTYVVSRLRGNAGQWFRFREFAADRLSWSTLREHLLRQYGRVHNRADLADELFSKQFIAGGDFEQFVWNFRNLYLLWDPTASEAEIISALVKRLPGPSSVLLMHVTRIEDLIQRFHRCQNIPSLAVTPPAAGRSENPPIRRPFRSMSSLEQPTERTTPGACYHCGQVGHTYRTCPTSMPFSAPPRDLSNITCFRCRNRGHVARNCPESAPVPEPPLNA